MKAVYVGRFNPMHLGHEAVIEKMIREFGWEDSLIVVGSAAAPQSMRHFFSYKDRTDFIKEIFPAVNIVGIPDYETDAEWLGGLDDIIASVHKTETFDVVFHAGCEDDVTFFKERGYYCEYSNRFDGTTPKVSATQVRESLLKGEPIGDLVNDRLVDLIKDRFEQRWSEFKTK